MQRVWQAGGVAAIGLLMAATTVQLYAADDRSAGDAQQRSVQRLVTEFSKARRNPAKRVQLIDQTAQHGEPAVLRLLAVLEKELAPQLQAYRERCVKVAQAFQAQQVRAAESEEVGRLRAAVLALREDPELTKEKIVEQGDPAMKRLAELLLPNFSAIASSSAALAKQRRALLEAGQMWQYCARAAAQLAAAKGEAAPPPNFEDGLRAEEESALQLVTALDASTRKTLELNAQLASKLDPEEARCIAACNLTRGLLGLNLLVIDPQLCQTSRDHSHDMQSLGFFSHESPVDGKTTPWDRAKRFDTTAASENIAVGVTQGGAANLMWFHSPGHHRNMLGDHVRIGVGRSGTHWTEMFGG